MSIVQGYRGYVKVGNALMPALPGSAISMPKNYNLPQYISGNNIYQLNAVEGLQFPVVSLVLAVTQGWLSAANLQAWAPDVSPSGRSAGDDIPTIGALSIYDGAGSILAEDCKLADMSLGASQGELVRCTARFFGGGGVQIDTLLQGAEIITANPAAFQHTGYAAESQSPAVGKIISWDLSYSNNPMPNPALPAAGHIAPNPYPSELNAGIFTARLRLTMQTDQAPPANGKWIDFFITPPGGSAVKLRVINPLRLDPYERTLQMPRQIREYNYVCLGKADAGVWTPPIQVLAG